MKPSNGRLTTFNTILGAILVILFGFLIRNVHQNAIQLSELKAEIRHCPCTQ